MGIPHLTTYLQPYASPVTLSGVSSKPPGEANVEKNVIIDGPALAYHVYYRLLASKPTSLGALEAVPTYDEIGKGVIIFLDTLRKHQIKMWAMFPRSKALR